MKLPEKKQRWVLHEDTLPQPAGAGVTRRVLAYTDGLMCVENTFEKGAVGALHHHPHTQITYVVSGAFEFTVDGVTRTVHKGDTILKEDGVEHGCVCTEAGILLDIFTPMREDLSSETLWNFCDRVIYVFAFCILLIILVGNAAVTAHASPAGEAVREAD